MLNIEFCEYLEFQISKALKNSVSEEINGFWCDGIILKQPDIFYSQKTVNDKKQVILKAFIGKDGQSEYELTLKFGKNSLSRFARNLDIKECIPNPEKPIFFDIDINLNKIKIDLD